MAAATCASVDASIDFGLRDLIGGLALLEAQRGLRLADLRGHAGGGLRVVGGVGLQFVRRDHGEPLIRG